MERKILIVIMLLILTTASYGLDKNQYFIQNAGVSIKGESNKSLCEDHGIYEATKNTVSLSKVDDEIGYRVANNIFELTTEKCRLIADNSKRIAIKTMVSNMTEDQVFNEFLKTKK